MPYKWRAFRKYMSIESIGSVIPSIMIVPIHTSSSGDNLISRVIDCCTTFENKVEPNNFQVVSLEI